MYLKHYRNDIAISYATTDNLPFPNATGGWVDELLKHLTWYLSQALKGAAYQLWSPQAIEGNQVIAAESLAQLQDSATVILLLSPTYLQAPDYQAELDAILTHIPVTSNRLFVVELTQLTRPAPLQAMPGYRLWTTDNRQRPRTLGFPEFQSDCDKTDYYNQLQDLASDLSAVLESLHEQSVPTLSVATATNTSNPETPLQVLLAEVTDDLYMRREEVKRYLEYNGIGILPLQPYPFDIGTAEWQAALTADLAQSVAFVQLLSDAPAQLTNGLPLPQWQFNTLQQVRPELLILQWRPATVQVARVQDRALSALLTGPEVRVTELERFKSEVVRQVRALTIAVDSLALPTNDQAVPYPGLRAFARDEVGIFFGRQPQVLQLLHSLQRFSFLAVVGPSGYGKSSLVCTGLLPALEAGLLTAAGSRWQVAVMRPGTALFTQLAASLWAAPDFQTAYTAGVAQMETSQAVALLAATLQRGPGSLTELLAGLALPDNSNVLLVIDQFEEIFRYYRQGAAEQAAAFVQLLLQSAAAQNAGISVYVVLTMRSDFLGDCAVFEGLPEAINQGLFLTPRLTREQLCLAITCPAERFGGQVAPALVNQLLNDGGDTPDQLPVLQHALLRMWDLAVLEGSAEAPPAGEKLSNSASTKPLSSSPVLTLEHYQQIGGLQNALSRHADEVLFSLPAEQQRVAELLFKCLTERVEGERDTRRPVLLQEVVALVAASAQLPSTVAMTEVQTVIEAFRATGRHFLTPSLELPLSPESVIDISHESFIRQWRRLQEWVSEEAEQAEHYQRLLDAALRHQQGKAGLWHTLELESSLRWRRHFQPTGVWAQRYTSGPCAEAEFNTALAFLESSAEAQLLEHRKRRRRVQSLVALLVLAIVLAGGAWYQFWEAERAKQAAIIEETKALRTQSLFLADLAQQQLRQDLTYTATRLALAALPSAAQPNRPVIPEARQALFDALQQPGVLEHPSVVNGAQFSPDGQRLLTYASQRVWLWDANTGIPLLILQGHQDNVNSAEFSPDGRYIVTASTDRTAKLWDALNGQLRATLPHQDKVMSAVFSPTGLHIVTAAEDNTARLWNASSGAPQVTLRGHQDDVNAAAFSPDGSSIVTASRDNTVRLWDVANGQSLAILHGHADKVMSAVFSPDGQHLLTRSADNTARLWDVASGTLLTTLRIVLAPVSQDDDAAYIYAVAFSPDGSTIATASEDNNARLWAVESGELLVTLQGHRRRVRAVAFSPDGAHLITASHDKTARLWDAVSGMLLATLEGHQKAIRTAAFSPDGQRIVTASYDNTARLWNTLNNGAPLAILQGHQDVVATAAFSPDSTRVVTAAWDKTVRVWDTASSVQLSTLQGHQGKVRSAVFSPDGKRIATAAEDNTTRLWETRSGTVLATLLGHEGTVWSVAFNPDGTRLVTASADSTARLWHVANGALLATLQGHQGYVMSAEFSPDKQYIVTASQDNTARLWDARSGLPLATLQGHQDAVYSAVFSPDGTHLVTASEDNTAGLWVAASGQLLATLHGHTRGVYAAAFSPDGARIVTASADNTAGLWDVASRTQLTTLHGHRSYVWSAAFSPDGVHVLTRAADNTVRLWDAASGMPLAILQGRFRSAVFSPDGTRIVTASDDETARLWRVFPDLTRMIQAAEYRSRYHVLTCAQRKQFFLLEKSAACPPV